MSTPDPGTIARPSPRLAGATWLGANYWSAAGGPFMWRDYDDAVVRRELRVLREHGLELTRSFLFWPDFQPAPDVVDDAFCGRYQRFLDTCADEGVRTIPTFLVGHMSGEDWDVAWRHGRDLYTDGFMLGQQAFFIAETVRRFGSSPAIAGWLISNEFTNYAGTAEPDDVRAWAIVCTQAVRAGGSSLPVSLGDGAWTKELYGTDNGFRLRRQLDLVDFAGPHSYPMGNDQARVHWAAALACELSHFGPPVVLEEFGVPNALSSEANAAHFYRQALHSSLLAGATGWIAWNNTDFDLTAQDPYRHHPFELGFGLTLPDGTPKAPLRELAAFRSVLDAVDVAGCRRTDTATAIVLPSYLDLHPRIPDADRRCITPITEHAYLAAKVADLAPAVVREESLDPGERPRLVLVPSNKLLTAPAFDLLEDWARAGSHVYLSWFAGVSGAHRGSWWPDVDGVTGARHTLRYGLREEVDDVVEWRFEAGLGDLAAGTTLAFPFAGTDQARAMLPLAEPSPDAGTVVLARDQRGRPALLRRTVGDGAVYVGTYPVEYFGSARPDAHRDDVVHRLYRALAHAAGAAPAVTVDDARVVVDGLTHESGRRYVWLVNLSADEVTAGCRVPAGHRLTSVLDRADLTTKVTLPSFGVVVAELVASS
ncbi:glycoside hydrolase 5 family protein [Jiangella anatolica]|uniref:glycoside hydrolase 5 family protein n=1 Tax=Jiangella anatolica TaxID=2670374 RepID=UPI0018F68562|nr:cellulase family glycosylhydrolase [Jiangella anatolica]